MKYKLININTEEEHLCDKVTIDGFDYYVSDEKCIKGDLCYDKEGLPGHKNNKYIIECLRTDDNSYWNKYCKKVIATNNQNIDIPKVVGDRLTIEVNNHFKNYWKKEDGTEMKGAEISASMMTNMLCETSAFIAGYNKSQETHPFSLDDVKEIFKIAQMKKDYGDYTPYTFEEAIQLWKEQKDKIIYYNG